MNLLAPSFWSACAQRKEDHKRSRTWPTVEDQDSDSEREHMRRMNVS